MYATYSALIGESQSGGKYKTRLTQLLHWCGTDFDGTIGKLEHSAGIENFKKSRPKNS